MLILTATLCLLDTKEDNWLSFCVPANTDPAGLLRTVATHARCTTSHGRNIWHYMRTSSLLLQKPNSAGTTFNKQRKSLLLENVKLLHFHSWTSTCVRMSLVRLIPVWHSHFRLRSSPIWIKILDLQLAPSCSLCKRANHNWEIRSRVNLIVIKSAAFDNCIRAPFKWSIADTQLLI